ncbi:MAG: IS1380 family transposase [Gemmatimonadales bacterium]
MSQGLLPYTVEAVPASDTLTARAGLPLVLEMMRALGLDRVIAEEVRVRERQSGYTEPAKVEALVLLLAAGGTCLDDIRVLQADAGLGRLLDRRLPAADTLRQFLYACHDDALRAAAQAARPPATVAYIPAETAPLQGLARVNPALVHGVAAQGQGTQATLDHDATVIESHKREALAHYQGGRGYQPAAVYWVEQDLVVADEYRDGNVPAGMANLPLIRRAFASLPPSVTTYYFRADSACYDERVLKWLADPQRPGGPAGPIGFTISADMTEDLQRACRAVPEGAWTLLENRLEETVEWTEVECTPGDWPKTAGPLRYLALRVRKKQGHLFAAGHDTKCLAVVTNRPGQGPALLRWHWQKAGTIELVHDVTKNELAAAVPPCGRFGANAAWYRLSLLTYNILSALKSVALPATLSAARPKRLRYTLFTLPGRLVTHAGRLLLRVSAEAERLVGLIAARARLAALQPQAATG